MKTFGYYLLKLAWFFLITAIATTYWKGYGWWFLVMCAIALMLGEALITRLFGKQSEKAAHASSPGYQFNINRKKRKYISGL